MFESLPKQIDSVPQYSFGPYVYRQPSLLPAAIVSALAPAVEKMAENLDPATRQQRELDKKEREYKETLIDRQLQHLNGGSQQLDADGIPLYDETGAPMSYEKKQDLLYKKALTTRALREPAGRAPSSTKPPAAQPGDRFYLPTNGMPTVSPEGASVKLPPPDIPAEGTNPEADAGGASSFPDVKLDITTGVPKMSLAENAPTPMPIIGGPLLADNTRMSGSIPDVASLQDAQAVGIATTDNAAPTTTAEDDTETSASDDSSQPPPAGPRMLKGLRAPDLGQAESSNQDGSWNTTTGAIYFPKDGHVEKKVPGGRLSWSSPNADPLFFPDAKPGAPKVVHDALGRVFNISDPDHPKEIKFPNSEDAATTEEPLKGLNDAEKARAQALVEGRMPVTSRMLAAKDPELKKVMDRAMLVDPTFSPATYDQRRKTFLDFTPGGKVGQNITSLNQTINHLGHLEDISEKLTGIDSTRFQSWNSLIQAGEKAIGANPNLRAYSLTAKALDQELAKLLKGGLATASEVKEWKEELAPTQSPDYRQTAFHNIISLLAGRMDSISGGYERVMGKPPSNLLTKGASGVLQRHGWDIGGGADSGDNAPASATPSPTPEAKKGVTPQAAYERAQQVLSDPASSPDDKAAAEKVMVSLRARGLLPDTPTGE